MAVDPWGSGDVPWRVKMERASAEIIRRVKVAAKNDPNFVPSFDDASLVLASRHFVLPPYVPERGSDDANDVLAGRVFAQREDGSGQGTPYNVPNTLVERDSVGNFAASQVQVVAIVATTTAGYDFQLLDPSLNPILRVPTGTLKVELLDSLKVALGFGCNGKAAQTAVTVAATPSAVAGTAGATYGATEQTLINALASALNSALSEIDTMRTALINNGILKP